MLQFGTLAVELLAAVLQFGTLAVELVVNGDYDHAGVGVPPTPGSGAAIRHLRCGTPDSGAAIRPTGPPWGPVGPRQPRSLVLLGFGAFWPTGRRQHPGDSGSRYASGRRQHPAHHLVVSSSH